MSFLQKTLRFENRVGVGNRTLDSEHAKLHDIINEIACSIIARDVDAMLAAFEIFEDCLRAYFVVEENIAQAANFDFTQHRLAHQGLLNEFQHIKNELMVRNDIFLSKADEKRYIDSLRSCLAYGMSWSMARRTL